MIFNDLGESQFILLTPPGSGIIRRKGTRRVSVLFRVDRSDGRWPQIAGRCTRASNYTWDCTNHQLMTALNRLGEIGSGSKQNSCGDWQTNPGWDGVSTFAAFTS